MRGFQLTLSTIKSAQAGIFTRNIFGEIYCGALDKCKMSHPDQLLPGLPECTRPAILPAIETQGSPAIS
jgi:hypothetical protein